MTAIPHHADAADFDAVFVVADDSGRKHYVFAIVSEFGGYQQWGAPREVLSRNVPAVEAWSRAVLEEREAA